jgi:hypothetical protein
VPDGCGSPCPACATGTTASCSGPPGPDIGAYLRELHGYGYDGWVTVEDFSTALPLAERTRDNVTYLRGIRAALT